MKVAVLACLVAVAVAAPQRAGSRPQFDEFRNPKTDCRYRCTMTTCKIDKCHYDCNRPAPCEQSVNKVQHYSAGSLDEKDQMPAASEVAPLIAAKDEVAAPAEVPTAQEPVAPMEAAASAPVEVFTAPLETSEAAPQQVIPQVADTMIPAESQPAPVVVEMAIPEKAPVEAELPVPVMIASESAPDTVIVEVPKDTEPMEQPAAPLSYSQVVETPIAESVQDVAAPVEIMQAAESVVAPVVVAAEKKPEVTKSEVSKEEETKQVEVVAETEKKVEQPAASEPIPAIVTPVEKKEVIKGEESQKVEVIVPKPAETTPVEPALEAAKEEVKPLGI